MRHAFVLLYRDGLVYKGRYVVNWCPGCGTAVSDLEVVEKKTQGTLYKIRYDVPGVPEGAVVATTRPETMLGDTALAIHPEDPRSAPLRGKSAVLPIVGRELAVVEDAILVDREFGTGIVKVTPAHDANDFAVGQRHRLPSVVVIGPDGKMTGRQGSTPGSTASRPARGSSLGSSRRAASSRRSPTRSTSEPASARATSSSRISRSSGS